MAHLSNLMALSTTSWHSRSQSENPTIATGCILPRSFTPTRVEDPDSTQRFVQLTDESSLEQLGERLLFLAMACHKLGDHEEANEWFTQAETWIKENAGPEDVHLQTIRKEAAALLTGTERQIPLTNESNSTGKKP
jgi:hypothetical protein